MAKKLPDSHEVIDEMISNRNHSWITEVYNRHKDDWDKVVIKYLGTDITYGKFFEESHKWAKVLLANNIEKGDEFVVCLDKCPEIIYLIGAASIIGAKIKLISEKFAPEFIEKNIKEADSALFFVQDTKVAKLKDILKKLPTTKVVPMPYKESANPDFKYWEIINWYYYLNEEKYNKALAELPNVIDVKELLKTGADYKGRIDSIVSLKDPFTTTYSSGTTKEGYPKGITHSIQHYILMGRYHDSEVSGIPSMDNLSTYSNIPVYSNSYLSSVISDNLIQGGIIILDPVDDAKYFQYGLWMYGANMNIATTSTWLQTAISYYANENKYKLPYAVFNFAVGEALSPGEEKIINQYQKDVGAGTALTKVPIVAISIAGGDCEHGSLFTRFFRKYANIMPRRNKENPIGMKGYNFAKYRVLRADGTYADAYEYGRLVCNSACTMLEYDRDPEATKKFFITDAYGFEWGDMNVDGYLDEYGNVSMKGRFDGDKYNIPAFFIADEISKDTKSIMSCEVIKTEVDGEVAYVAHIMPQLKRTGNQIKILKGIIGRCERKFGSEITNKIYIRFRTVTDYYPITSSEKRDIKTLAAEGISKASNLYDLLNNGLPKKPEKSSAKNALKKVLKLKKTSNSDEK